MLKFDSKLSVDMSEQAYAKFKEICLQNYFELAQTYAKKDDASTFLEKFAKKMSRAICQKMKSARNLLSISTLGTRLSVTTSMIAASGKGGKS